MWLFKCCGMALILLVCSMWGILKSAAVKKRAEKLTAFSRAVGALGERIRAGGGEISSLLRQSFTEGLLDFGEDGFEIDEGYLKKEDIDLLNEFFTDLGLGDTDCEYRRISGYAAIIKSRGEEAQGESESLCRLYKSTGFLGGLFLCIFFL